MALVLNFHQAEKISKEQQELLIKAAETAVYTVKDFARFLIDNEFNVSIDLSFLSAEEMRELNQEQRGIDRVTDVLSFPLLHFREGELAEEAMTPFFIDPEAEFLTILLGDIVICPSRASQQAEDYGHSLERELAFLTVHGTLHLLGFDHQDLKEEERMRELQRIVMKQLNLSRGE
ncbi:MAG: rRNA maturation RNase YbeY [Eubacteriales bacterium]|nr:rRNA maturation RNase YbeY [Eubacteriales bacterium]